MQPIAHTQQASSRAVATLATHGRLPLAARSRRRLTRRLSCITAIWPPLRAAAPRCPAAWRPASLAFGRVLRARRRCPCRWREDSRRWPSGRAPPGCSGAPTATSPGRASSRHSVYDDEAAAFPERGCGQLQERADEVGEVMPKLFASAFARAISSLDMRT